MKKMKTTRNFMNKLPIVVKYIELYFTNFVLANMSLTKSVSRKKIRDVIQQYFPQSKKM